VMGKEWTRAALPRTRSTGDGPTCLSALGFCCCCWGFGFFFVVVVVVVLSYIITGKKLLAEIV